MKTQAKHWEDKTREMREEMKQLRDELERLNTLLSDMAPRAELSISRKDAKTSKDLADFLQRELNSANVQNADLRQQVSRGLKSLKDHTSTQECLLALKDHTSRQECVRAFPHTFHTATQDKTTQLPKALRQSVFTIPLRFVGKLLNALDMYEGKQGHRHTSASYASRLEGKEVHEQQFCSITGRNSTKT